MLGGTLAGVVQREDAASWIQGPGGEDGYPGERLGRPAAGPRSIGGPGRRFAGLTIDWVLCVLIARALFGPSVLRPDGSLAVNAVFAAVNLVLIGTAGATLGQRLLGLRVETVDGAAPGLIRAAPRAVLVTLGLPALTLIWQQDRRGLHELASGTLVARR
jgi:uncharacterized RDD family membrane protein YckC